MNKHLYRTDERRTIKQWLRAIEDPTIKEQALENYKNIPRTFEDASSLSIALNRAFAFRDAPEGGDYWREIYVKLQKEEGDYKVIKDWVGSNLVRRNALKHVVLSHEAEGSTEIAEVVNTVKESKEEEYNDRNQFKPTKVS